MPTKIGHFEILSELAKSPTGAVYKANDPESNQTIALKAIQLSAFGESAQALEHALLAEAESTNILSSPNISKVFGAGEIEGRFCAAMEYVQGNSIATMLARKEGFSIWDLLDIGRQLCGGLDHANSHKLVHYSLEPAKIMCGWDGTVKILSFGISSVGKFTQAYGELPTFLHYMSPEQVQGQETDGRSNLYSLGAMMYEMVTERKAFDREDAESLRQSILESTPVAPIHVNPKIHPLLSNLIMKAIAKDPALRYQSGRELLDDLEQCKESKPAKKAEPVKVVKPPEQVQGAQPKFAGPAASKPAVAPAAAASALARRSAPATAKPSLASSLAQPSRLATPKAAAAAAGVGAGNAVAASSHANATPSEIQELDLSDQFIAPPAKTGFGASAPPSAYMSAGVADEPAVETFEPQAASPKIAVDPMMAEGASGGGAGTSFSEISELPPLKEVYIAPPPPPADLPLAQSAVPATTMYRSEEKEEKPKIQPKEVAQKAIKEIKGLPPKLMLYSLGAAGVLILIIGICVTLYIHSQSDEDSGAPRPTVVEEKSVAPEVGQTPVQPQTAPSSAATAPAPSPQVEEPAAQPAPATKSRNNKKKAQPAPAAVVIPGQLAIESTPAGAQVQVDGASDPSWVTPFTLTNLQPGQHSITISKPGYATDSRSIEVTAGNRAAASIHLAQLVATLVVKSDPSGASIYVDGKDTGTKTPGQVSVDKGQHLVLVRLSGYLDETMSAQFALGQTTNFSPTLQTMGNADSIKTVGKMSRLFGGKGQPGQAALTIRTQPKGAQVAINQRMLDHTSPVEAMLDPGNYVVDITLSGYQPVHKVITATKNGKVVIDETLQAQ